MTTVDQKPSRVETPVATSHVRTWRPSLGRYTGVVTALFIVCAYLGVTQPLFLTWVNITNIVAGNSVVLVLALGATVVIISGGIDMSTASVTGACGMVLGVALDHGLPFVVALLAPFAMGLVIGLINGVLISWLKLSFLVVTLGGMSIWASFSLVVNDGRTISVFSTEGFRPLYRFVNGDVMGIPNLLAFDVVIVLTVAAMLRYTSFGRSLYAVGSNTEAARINGINVSGAIFGTYVVAGLTASVASVLQVGRLTAAASATDMSMLMTVIAAVLIGGATFTGGEGGVLGTVIGCVFLGVIANGLTLSDVSAFWQGAVNGLILIGAVGISALRDSNWMKRRSLDRRRRSGMPAPELSSSAD